MLTAHVLDLATEIRAMLRMSVERREYVYGNDGWKLLMLRYIELVERDN
jgi:hypothetical protein